LMISFCLSMMSSPAHIWPKTSVKCDALARAVFFRLLS
jgi:hypothetical protein